MRLYEEMKQLQNEVQRAARLFPEPRQLLMPRRVPLDKTCHVDERQL